MEISIQHEGVARGVDVYFHESPWSRSLPCAKGEEFKIETSSVKEGGYKM